MESSTPAATKKSFFISFNIFSMTFHLKFVGKVNHLYQENLMFSLSDLKNETKSNVFCLIYRKEDDGKVTNRCFLSGGSEHSRTIELIVAKNDIAESCSEKDLSGFFSESCIDLHIEKTIGEKSALGDVRDGVVEA